VNVGDTPHALAVDPVLEHQSGDHGLDSRRARPAQQHRGPVVGSERVDRQQPRADLILQVEELRLAMAEIGLQQAFAHTRRQRQTRGPDVLEAGFLDDARGPTVVCLHDEFQLRAGEHRAEAAAP